MVTIKGFQQKKNAEGKAFLVLELEGDLQVQTSKTTGKLYASKKKCTLPCTFEAETARELVGSTLPGDIVKIPCEPYSFINQATGEAVTLSYRHIYSASVDSSEQIRRNITPKFEEIDVL